MLRFMSAKLFHQIFKFGRERGRWSLVLSGALCTELWRPLSLPNFKIWWNCLADMNRNVKDYLILKGDFDFAIPWITLPLTPFGSQKGVLTLIPMGGGRGVFFQIQIIGFETGTKLSGWNLDDNLILDVFKAYMKLFLLIHYRNLSKISILKRLVPIFSLFRAFFVILWLWGKVTWLWIGSAGFESWWDQIFFKKYSYI